MRQLSRSLFLTAIVVAIGLSPSACKLLSRGEAHGDAGALASSASAAPDTTASTAAAASANPGAPVVAAPAGVRGLSEDPNAPPTHEDHERAAAAEIHKDNYKSELDKLEKEPLKR